MGVILNFLKNYYTGIVMMLFFISSAFLIASDAKEHGKNSLKKEQRFAMSTAYAYIFIGITAFIIVKLL